jgi:hypothetical protein
MMIAIGLAASFLGIDPGLQKEAGDYRCGLCGGKAATPSYPIIT